MKGYGSRSIFLLVRTKGTSTIRFTAGVGLALVLLFACNWGVRAQTDRFVSPTGDDISGSNDCTSPDQPCKTIQNAVNHSGSGDLIELASGTYPEDVIISQSVTIQGDPTFGSTVKGNLTGSVIHVSSGVTATLAGLTITNGFATTASGFDGGGVDNGGSLTITDCVITGNGAAGLGGGISNSGEVLNIINSTISDNSASYGGGIFAGAATNISNSTLSKNDAGLGGGLYNHGDTVTLTNTTVSDSEDGGGLYNDHSTLNLTNVTISHNSSSHGAAGVFNSVGMMSLTNSIISGTSGGNDCVNNGAIVTNDHNLVQDGTCSPLLSGDPKLGPLQNNGGPTFTRALLPGSPAINAGDDSVLGDPLNLTTDQRGPGFARNSCAHVDIGAYEFASNAPPTINCPANVSATAGTGQTTATVSFGASAMDLCGGALTLTYKIGNTVIASPHAFPLGVSTVTVSATTLEGVTGACSFTVTVTQLNICIQDDHSGDTLQFSSQTGQYVYTRCRDKFTLSGTGVVRNSGGFISLTDSRSDRRISASFNPGTLTGRATITDIIAQGVTQTIVISETNPHPTCACP